MSGDFDFEPVRGLPGPLPAGETLLWQGAPDLKAMALQVFHVRKVALYFGLLAAWRFAIVSQQGASLAASVSAALLLVGLGVAAAAILGALAFLVCRTTVYSITSRRVVMRIGVALPITFNLPFAVIGSAALKLNPDGTGSIPLSLAGQNRLAYLIIWPHARPWRMARAEPTLRLIPDAAAVAHILAKAVAAAFPETVQPAVLPVTQTVAAGDKKARPLTPAAA